jgi:hypothetical protein
MIFFILKPSLKSMKTFNSFEIYGKSGRSWSRSWSRNFLPAEARPAQKLTGSATLQVTGAALATVKLRDFKKLFASFLCRPSNIFTKHLFHFFPFLIMTVTEHRYYKIFISIATVFFIKKGTISISAGIRFQQQQLILSTGAVFISIETNIYFKKSTVINFNKTITGTGYSFQQQQMFILTVRTVVAFGRYHELSVFISTTAFTGISTVTVI